MRSARLLVVVLLGLPALAAAQNVLSVTDTTVEAGELDLVVPIELSVDQDLTRLRFDLAFDPAFCDQLDDEDDIELSSNGRTIGDPDDEIIIICSDGSIRVDIRDDDGALVIPAGSGPIIDVEFNVLKDTAAGSFTFTPTNLLARNGTTDVPIQLQAGTLAILPPATTTTTTSTVPTTSPGPSDTSTSSTTGPPATTSTTVSATTSTTGVLPTTTTTTTAPAGERCDDALDNDGDGRVDCADEDCATDPACTGCRAGSPDGALAGLRCAVGALAARANAEVTAGRLPGGLARTLARGLKGVMVAELRCQDGSTRRAQTGLRGLVRALIAFRHRLGLHASRVRIPPEVRAPLRETAATLLSEAQSMRRSLACPPT